MELFIVRGENHDNPGKKKSRVWKRDEIHNMCTRGAIAENNKIEAIEYIDNWANPLGDGSRLCMIVSNMKHLRWLRVRVNIFPDEYDGGLSFLSNELKYIYWRNYPASPFPDSFQPVKLVAIKLHGSLQKELWMAYKCLPSLKVLELLDMDNLLSAPDFSGLPCLQKFILDGCFRLEEIHPSLGYHTSLEFIQVKFCSHLQMFPNNCLPAKTEDSYNKAL
uniref:disease resistance protein Roq1-like n=1 Tax=Erigeron canadensis TaxID=72917 RepID=UPI001CB8BB28|nr:disease resistance protein Roq1-like [Erigeron canadensis]XP_043631886.1 disease resistance protein Roq1-like [Erigeron canadensis]